MKTPQRHVAAPLALIGILALALAALAFVPSASLSHAAATTVAYWVFIAHG